MAINPEHSALPGADTDPADDSQLSPKIATRVQELRDVIASYGTDGPSKKWYPEEDELLQILRKSDLPYHRVAVSAPPLP